MEEILKLYPKWATESFGDVHFVDFYLMKLENKPSYSVDYLSRRWLSYDPLIMKILVKIRNVIVAPFGLKTSFGKSKPEILYFEKGSILVYFHVWQRDGNTIVVEEKDGHLNFRILFHAQYDESTNEMIFKLSTLVHFNNLIGKIYFTLIRLFHHSIMRYSVNKLRIEESHKQKLL